MTLPPQIKAVNLGCGTSIAPGWINLDNSPNARLSKYPQLRWLLWKLHILSEKHYKVQWDKEIITQDIRKKLPFADNSIDYLYTSHTLEHITNSDTQKVVRDIFRVLKPGGLVRIVVPDLAFGARRYLEALQHNAADTEAAPSFLNWMQLSKPGHRDPHLWMYDAPSLSLLLTKAGFINVTVCTHKTGRVPDCDILDNRPVDSLHMEAEKPSYRQTI